MKYVEKPRLLLELKMSNVLDSSYAYVLYSFIFIVFTVKVYCGEVCEVAFLRGWILPTYI